jgi:hypothetical protein
VGGQREGGNDSRISMVPIMGDGNGEGDVIGCDRFRRGRGRGGKAAL